MSWKVVLVKGRRAAIGISGFEKCVLMTCEYCQGSVLHDGVLVVRWQDMLKCMVVRQMNCSQADLLSFRLDASFILEGTHAGGESAVL